MKQNLKTFLIPFTSVLLAIAPAVLFTFVVLPFYVGAVLAGVGVLYLICALAVNCILTAKTKRRMMKTPLSVWETEFKKRREEIHAGLDAERKKVDRLIMRTILYNLTLCFAVFMINCGGVILARAFLPLTEDFGAVEFCALTAAACSLLFVIFYVPFTSPLLRFKPKKNGEQFFQNPLSKRSFPLLYEIAKRSAEAVDYNDTFLLYPSSDNGISVGENCGVCSIFLSPETVSLLTEEELYSVLVHEFAHAAHKDTKLLTKYRNSVSRYSEPPKMKAFSNAFFSYSAYLLQQKTDLLLQYSSILLENKADAEVKRLSLGQVFMNATAKVCLFDETFREPIEEFALGIYEDEIAPDDYYSRKVEYYKEHVHEIYPRALEIMLRRLSAYNDTHPTFGMRADMFGVSEFELFSYPEEEYAVEVRTFCAQCDRELYGALSAQWKDLHEENFVQPKEICERYEEAPEKATELLSMLALNTYQLYDYDKTLHLAETLLTEDESNNSALLHKAMVLCMRDNLEGLPLLLEAMHADHNWANHFGLYGETILRSGKQELLDELRKMQAAFAQEVFDKAKKQYKEYCKMLRNLKPCPDSGRRQKIIQSVEAVSQDILKNIYLAQSETPEGVKKIILFIPAPDPGTVQEKLIQILQQYFSLLWRRNEQYYVYHLAPHRRLWKKVTATALKIV